MIDRPASHLAGAALILLALILGSCAPGAPVASQATSTPRPTTAPTPTATPIPTPSATPEPNYDEIPQAAFEPEELVGQILLVEASLRDPSVTGPKLKWMGYMQQLTYSRLQEYPDWKDPVIGALPAEYQPLIRRTLEAGQQLRRLRGPTPRALPNWQILEPKPVEQLMAWYKEAEAEFGIPWYFLASIHHVESRMGRIRGLSSAGAQGPMQFLPSTWAAYGLGGDINDDHDAIRGAANYLRASGGPGDMARALFAYNRHEAYVNAITYYAEVMKADPNMYRGYHGWQVYYTTTDGTYHLHEGWKTGDEAR